MIFLEVHWASLRMIFSLFDLLRSRWLSIELLLNRGLELGCRIDDGGLLGDDFVDDLFRLFVLMHLGLWDRLLRDRLIILEISPTFIMPHGGSRSHLVMIDLLESLFVVALE